jgi:hypothetical protein
MNGFSLKRTENTMLTLKEEQWGSVYITDDINVSYQRFFGILYCYFNTAFPLKRSGIKNKSNKAWISKGILKSRNRMLFCIVRKTKITEK